MPNVTARDFLRITVTPPERQTEKRRTNFVVRETLPGVSQLVNEPRRVPGALAQQLLGVVPPAAVQSVLLTGGRRLRTR